MRIVSTLPASTRNAVTLSPCEIGCDLELRIGGVGVLARVTREHFDEMVRLGHAVDAPELKIKSDRIFGVVNYSQGGPTIYRADAEVRGGTLWLVPEQEQTQDVLMFYLWDAWMTEGREIKIESGCSQLAHLESKEWRKHYCVLVLEPGGGVKFSTMRQEEIPGSRATTLTPWRRTQYKDVWVESIGPTLSQDGETLDI